ncbi:hypothetical protein HGI32_13490 [Clostridium acetobutylicum]|uniref:Uncharacterized protein n=2 Tax=Clostridiaceae TaxID=31979 RepID=Q97G54_CLOAB|nr:Hypothetical protein CA_C2515 [Clostridium acetobutylicum ATCC 824]AEI32404.1 hypothetical protein SMB_G2550 [Clostridium acetobutylicum DSM 1731]AWV79114.1 hypothetical protein DK921_03175 [Clostridium acetobutylicum]PSM07074.1 hypothetical protein C7T89_03175 [Clostridium sp. NJ4]MBC2394924.1 hypothetical protein [Clostridium acetobutylicum]
MPNMEKYNLINEINSIMPNYDVKNKDISLDVYVSPKQEVCIIGRLDSNYICWCSITNLQKKETTIEILNCLLKYDKKFISNESVLGNLYKEVMSWHKLSIKRVEHKDGPRYYSPVNNCFCGGEEYNNGEFLFNEISTFYSLELSKCNYRLIDNSYTKILNEYKNILTKDTDSYYYWKMKPLISILQSESYIKLCRDEKIRNLYLACVQECSNLYNRYMTAVR